LRLSFVNYLILDSSYHEWAYHGINFQ